MVKVKILVIKGGGYDYDSDSRDAEYLAGVVSEWEDITEEEYKLLKRDWYSVSMEIKKEMDFDLTPILLVADRKPIAERILSVQKLIEKRMKEDEAAKLKAQIAAANREAKKRDKEAKRIQDEKELFEMLKAKYESGALEDMTDKPLV